MTEPLRRPDLYVVARMLEALLENGGSYPRGRFQGASGLNYETYQRYLQFLVSRDLVHLVEGKDGPEVRLASRGLQVYHDVVMSIKELVGHLP